MITLRIIIASIFVGVLALNAAPITLTVATDAPGATINPAMWGIFFEDINLGADGGLYAELVKNRSFEFTEPLMGWIKIEPAGARGSFNIREQNPLHSNNPHYLQVTVENAGDGFGLRNEGFRGIGVRQGDTYRFSTWARSSADGPVGLRIELVGSDGRSLGQAKLDGFTAQWKKHAITLRAAATTPKAHLNIYLAGRGTLDLDMISLFPERTWKNRPEGLRPDVVQILADLKPGFLRFPGGCIVEGHYLATRYQWKTTIGAPEERRLIINRWNNEFKHRPTPDYFQTFGLGFYEYFLLCEDLGAAPLPILNCGMACQFNSNELVPLDQLTPYLQDALDLIEFANGPATSTWGRKRAEMGHPAPFNMKLLGIGNEQWGPQYLERYEPFAKVLKQQHPDIQLVTSAGPDPDGEKFNFLWPKLRALKADLVDEHYYRPPVWFLDNTHRYDQYDRTGPKFLPANMRRKASKPSAPITGTTGNARSPKPRS
jgi:hypothetical protein